MSSNSVTQPLYLSCTVQTGTPSSSYISLKKRDSRHSLGSNLLIPGTSHAATYTSAFTTFLSVAWKQNTKTVNQPSDNRQAKIRCQELNFTLETASPVTYVSPSAVLS